MTATVLGMAGILPATLNHEALDLGIASESHQKAVGISANSGRQPPLGRTSNDTANIAHRDTDGGAVHSINCHLKLLNSPADSGQSVKIAGRTIAMRHGQPIAAFR